MTGRGPLAGTRVVEVAGLGPAPYAGMLLADLGADVLRVDRPGPDPLLPREYALSRGRQSVVVDLKRPEGREVMLDLVERADIVIEGFRPGVAERLGIGPDACAERNPRLVYGRVTGWGQDGPAAHTAGHDLNYLAATGALMLFSRGGAQPATPPGLVADFAGGGLMLAFGLVSALWESRSSGRGQVVDTAMVDGVASLTTLLFSMAAQGRWHEEPGVDVLDGGAPFYDTYATADGRYVAVAALEPQFYAVLLDVLGLDPANVPDRDDPARWPELRRVFTEVFARRDRDDWARLFAGTDACVTPVLTLSEATTDAHLAARGTYDHSSPVVQPSVAPRFSRTPGAIAGPPPLPGEHTRTALVDWGLAGETVDLLLRSGVVVQRPGDAPRRTG